MQSERIYEVHSHTYVLHENQQLGRVGAQSRLDIATLMHQTSLGRHFQSLLVNAARAPGTSKIYM